PPTNVHGCSAPLSTNSNDGLAVRAHLTINEWPQEPSTTIHGQRRAPTNIYGALHQH
ncbi:hypothetical protein K443DRAFT_118005, partial [Laccaria amethystina LaAM-08-1]